MKKFLHLSLPGLFLAICVAIPVWAGESVASAGNPDAVAGKGLAWQQEGGDLVKKHCTTCHSEGRIMSRLQTMHATLQESYEQQLKSIVLTKIRLTNGSISRQDGRKILDYLAGVWHRDQPGFAVSLPMVPENPPAASRTDAVRSPGRPS